MIRKISHFIVTFWRYVGWIGVDVTQTDAKRKIILNRFTFVVSSVAITYSGIFLLLGFTTLSVLAFGAFASVSFTFFWQKKNYNNFAKFWMMIFTNLAVFIFSDALGKESGVHYLFFPCLTYGLLYFNGNELKKAFSGIGLTVFFLVLLETTNYNVFSQSFYFNGIMPADILSLLNVSILFVAFSVLAYGLYLPMIANYKYEMQLKESSEFTKRVFEKHKAILAAIPDEVFVCSRSGMILDYKAATEEQEKLRQQIIGLSTKDIFAPEIAEKIGSRIEFVLKNRTIEMFEYQTNGENLAYKEVRISKLGLNDGIVIVRDVTDMKKQELVIEEQRMAVLQTARLSELAEMAMGVAHEINNPLAIIEGYVDEIMDLKKSNSLADEEMFLMLKKIMSTSQRIVKIVRSLRAISKNTKNDPYSNSNISEILQDLSVLSRERLKNLGIDLQIEVAQDFKLECRSSEIVQVLMNLVSNSRDAVSKLEQKWIRIQAFEVGENVQLRIWDSGKGIPENLRHKIFQPFFTTKDIGQGSGLGMAIALNIIQNHRGKIELDVAAPNTCFVITLPKRHSQQSGIAA